MLRTRTKRRADHGVRAQRTLTAIHAAIAGLPDEDLLDLADIFTAAPPSPMLAIATDEMTRRGISL